jgi:hypothetical protein
MHRVEVVDLNRVAASVRNNPDLKTVFFVDLELLGLVANLLAEESVRYLVPDASLVHQTSV